MLRAIRPEGFPLVLGGDSRHDKVENIEDRRVDECLSKLDPLHRASLRLLTRLCAEPSSDNKVSLGQSPVVGLPFVRSHGLPSAHGRVELGGKRLESKGFPASCQKPPRWRSPTHSILPVLRPDAAWKVRRSYTFLHVIYLMMRIDGIRLGDKTDKPPNCQCLLRSKQDWHQSFAAVGIPRGPDPASTPLTREKFFAWTMRLS